MWTTTEKWECARRELVLRIRVYARQVAAGKMSQEQCGREIALMNAIAEDYRQLVEREHPDMFKEKTAASDQETAA